MEQARRGLTHAQNKAAQYAEALEKSESRRMEAEEKLMEGRLQRVEALAELERMWKRRARAMVDKAAGLINFVEHEEQ